eukprot:GHVS01013690.1.p1 GENE.GHVS01013690.1~~GHVS01013690.1.p1  ORF type:complete len:281 (-),score=84.14 GHVS01013690.1:699-1448(-)
MLYPLRHGYQNNYYYPIMAPTCHAYFTLQPLPPPPCPDLLFPHRCVVLSPPPPLHLPPPPPPFPPPFSSFILPTTHQHHHNRYYYYRGCGGVPQVVAQPIAGPRIRRRLWRGMEWYEEAEGGWRQEPTRVGGRWPIDGHIRKVNTATTTTTAATKAKEQKEKDGIVVDYECTHMGDFTCTYNCTYSDSKNVHKYTHGQQQQRPKQQESCSCGRCCVGIDCLCSALSVSTYLTVSSCAPYDLCSPPHPQR